jgi:hypothetical protein
MTQVDTDQGKRLGRIEELLTPMRQTLGADGFQLDITTELDGGVRLSIEATPGACADCLVPRSVFVALTVDALAKGGVDIQPSQIDILYPDGSMHATESGDY